jgi:GAF domain-containing protein
MDDTELVAQLARLAEELGPGLEPAGATDHLQDVVETVRELLGAAACSVSVVDPDEETLVFLAAAGEGADRVVSTSMPLSKGIAGFVVASGQALTISDTKQDTRFADDIATSTGYVPTSILAVPLQTADDVIGVLEVLDAEVEPDANTSRLLELLARQATLTLQTMAVFDDLGTALLRALGKAADDDGDLGEALDAAAARLRGPVRELTELAGLFYSLGRLGPEERSAAIRLLASFVTYAKLAAPQP